MRGKRKTGLLSGGCAEFKRKVGRWWEIKKRKATGAV